MGSMYLTHRVERKMKIYGYLKKYGLTVRKTTFFIIMCLLLNSIAIFAGTKYCLENGRYLMANQLHSPYIVIGTVWFESILRGSLVDFSVNPTKSLSFKSKPIFVTEQFLSPADISPSKDNAPATVAFSCSSIARTASMRQLSLLMTTVGLPENQERNFSIDVNKEENSANKSIVKIPFRYKFYQWAFWILLSAMVIAYIIEKKREEKEVNCIMNHKKNDSHFFQM
jgi:hypothetical protein